MFLMSCILLEGVRRARSEERIMKKKSVTISTVELASPEPHPEPEPAAPRSPTQPAARNPSPRLAGLRRI